MPRANVQCKPNTLSSAIFFTVKRSRAAVAQAIHAAPSYLFPPIWIRRYILRVPLLPDQLVNKLSFRFHIVVSSVGLLSFFGSHTLYHLWLTTSGSSLLLQTLPTLSSPYPSIPLRFHTPLSTLLQTPAAPALLPPALFHLFGFIALGFFPPHYDGLTRTESVRWFLPIKLF